MSTKLLSLVLLLTTTSPLFAQSVRERTSDTVKPGRTDAAGTPDLADVAKRIVNLTNKFRTEEGRSELTKNDILTRTAGDFADYLARTDKFSHTADGNEPWDRAAAHGYEYCIVLENIAWEFNSEGFTAPSLAEAFVEGWKKSPGHRKNMRDRDVTETGVGVAHSAETGRFYAVQMFGRPHSAAISFQVTNETDGVLPFMLDGKKQAVRPGYTATYQRCRPAEVHFPSAPNADDAANGQARRPRNGTHYVVRSGEDGKYRIAEQ
jgi:uncharacterized protein YkwD